MPNSRTTALLIIDVQKAAKPNPAIVQRIERLQADYAFVFVSKFINRNSPLLPLTGWSGYDDESLAFTPSVTAVVFEKNIYSSYIEALKDFEEVHLCGFDTDACVYKTALDLVEHGIRPVVLSQCCGSETAAYHEAGLLLIKRNIGPGNVV